MKPKNKMSRKESNAEYYRKNKDRIKLRQQEYNQRNREVIAAQHAQAYRLNKKDRAVKAAIRYRKNKKQKQEYDRAYRAIHREKLNARAAAYRAAHPKCSAKSKARYAANNMKLLIAKTSAYRKTPKGRAVHLNSNHRRRAKKMACETRASASELKQFIEDATHCFYCKRTNLKLVVEHFVSLKKGGLHSMDNIVASCISCNSRKHTKDPHDFIREIADRANVE